MLDTNDILDTIRMISDENLDVRTVTMGISLLDCADADGRRACEKIYNKITSRAKNLVRTAERISATYGMPIVNKRVSVTPIAMAAGQRAGCRPRVVCPRAGRRRQNRGRKLHWRVFGPGAQGLFRRG